MLYKENTIYIHRSKWLLSTHRTTNYSAGIVVVSSPMSRMSLFWIPSSFSTDLTMRLRNFFRRFRFFFHFWNCFHSPRSWVSVLILSANEAALCFGGRGDPGLRTGIGSALAPVRNLLMIPRILWSLQQPSWPVWLAAGEEFLRLRISLILLKILSRLCSSEYKLSKD